MEADKLWNLQIYELTSEYYQKMFFLPPFSVFFYAGYSVTNLFKFFRSKFTKKGFERGFLGK